MASYGRNFDFRIPPDGEDRKGRFATPAGSSFPIGAPVEADDTAGIDSGLDLQVVKLAVSGEATAGKAGRAGILVYEHINSYAFAGTDPLLTTYSDLNTAPGGAAVQVVHDPDIKFVLRNTSARTFLNTRNYTAFTMVAGLGATPTLAVGDYLEPHSDPSSTNGYWQETSTVANAWAVVTKVDSDRGEVECQMLF